MKNRSRVIHDAMATSTQRQKRRSIPGAGEFDSGERDVSERAEEILREASAKKWRRKSPRGLSR
jgi:hypothetical protein